MLRGNSGDFIQKAGLKRRKGFFHVLKFIGEGAVSSSQMDWGQGESFSVGPCASWERDNILEPKGFRVFLGRPLCVLGRSGIQELEGLGDLSQWDPMCLGRGWCSGARRFGGSLFLGGPLCVFVRRLQRASTSAQLSLCTSFSEILISFKSMCMLCAS